MPESVTLQVRRLIERINRMSEVQYEALRDALAADMTVTMQRARDVYCPVDTGLLRSTHRVVGPRRRGNRAIGSIEAGGRAAPYAVYVYYRTDLTHKPPTQAFWLEKAVNERLRTESARIARRMNAALRRVAR